jgi:uncharacterized membrane protein YcjF (UPF0283 family)
MTNDIARPQEEIADRLENMALTQLREAYNDLEKRAVEVHEELCEERRRSTSRQLLLDQASSGFARLEESLRRDIDYYKTWACMIAVLFALTVFAWCSWDWIRKLLP